jgi:hypothetical protein
MQYGTMILMAILSAISFVGLRYGLELFKSKRVKGIFTRLAIELRGVVVETNSDYVNDLRKANEDGVLTDEEKQLALEKAISKLKENIGMKGLQRIVKVLGIESLESWLGTHIAGMVEDVKKATPPKQ